MFVKKYIARDMSEAMEKIRKELGSDALILNSKAIRQKGIFGFFKKKMLEVVAASDPVSPGDDAGKPKSKTKPLATALKNEENDNKIDQLNDKIFELNNIVKNFTEKIKIIDKNVALAFSPEITTLFNRLVEQDVSLELAREICEKAQEIFQKTAEAPEDIVKNLIVEGLGDGAQIKLKKYKKNVIMFVGPTGVGKTTSLVKLASKYALKDGMKVGIINADTYRVAAQEQLKTYADILGVALITVYNAEELSDAFKALEDADIILVDTAGKSSSDETYHRDIENYLSTIEANEVLVTLSMVTGINACREIINNYSFVKNYKILLTKTDELKAWGNIFNIASFADKPLVYITTGQNVPDDIEPVDANKIADRILGSV